jgi:hypothetical protein
MPVYSSIAFDFSRKTARLLLFSVVLLCFLLEVSAQTPGSDMRVSGIKAMAFFETTGAFSTDLVPMPEHSLWNIGLGGGSLGYPSSSTFVVVEVTADETANSQGRRLEFTARYKAENKCWEDREGITDCTLRQMVVIRRLSITIYPGIPPDRANSKYYAGFWLYHTGCQPVALSARIVGQRRALTVRKKIYFACGE